MCLRPHYQPPPVSLLAGGVNKGGELIGGDAAKLEGPFVQRRDQRTANKAFFVSVFMLIIFSK